MKQYHDLALEVLAGDRSDLKFDDRTGQTTISVFGYQCVHDLREGFPLLTTKKLHMRSITHELLWMIKGDSNIKYLNDNDVTIWDEWADEDGELGPVYGKQWRSWLGTDGKTVDQLENVVNNIKNNPSSRRHLVSAWNVGEVEQMALPPCHLLFQFYVSADGHLDVQLYQRSADIFLGVPFNKASYGMLLEMMAQETNLRARYFVHTFGDAHFYAGNSEATGEWYLENYIWLKKEVKKIMNSGDIKQYQTLSEIVSEKLPESYGSHVPQILTQLSREERPLPTLKLNPDKGLFDMEFEDIQIENYNPHPRIKGDVAV